MLLEGQPDMYTLAQESAAPASGLTQEVMIETVDGFCRRRGVDHISLLKIDTEGHDLAVLVGAEDLLRRQAIDLIDVEAGMNPENQRHVPVGEFSSYLETHGYRLFGIYRQTNEWPTGEPHLRRADLVFVSDRVIRANVRLG
jgi:hypothetical protein